MLITPVPIPADFSTPPTNGQALVYDSTSKTWKPGTIVGGVTSFNTRTGAVTLVSGDVTGALGFTPVDAAASDPFTGYALLAGRAGGQTLKGGTAASENLTLQSTANASRGSVQCVDDFYPSTDNAKSLGSASKRWANVLADRTRLTYDLAIDHSTGYDSGSGFRLRDSGGFTTYLFLSRKGNDGMLEASQGWMRHLSKSKFEAAQVSVPVTLTDAATIATNAALGNSFRVTLGADRTLGAPTNPTDGQVCTWEVTASGAIRTLTLASGAGGFAFGSTITGLTAIASGTTDFITAEYNSTADRWRVIQYVKGY